MKRSKICYSDKERTWISRNRDLPRIELHALFVRLYCRKDVTADHIKALCTREGWSAGAAGRTRNKGKSSIFSEAEIGWIRANGGLSRVDVGAAFRQHFGRNDVSDAQIVGWRKRNAIKTGRNGRFEPGQIPWSKGKRLPFNAGSARTQFKTGSLPHNSRPIGYETIDRNGYVKICVDRPNPYRPDHKTHMAFKHKELWEAKNGPVPQGQALKSLDGNKLNCDPSNWEAVPKGLLPRLNGRSRRDYDQAPAEVKPTIMAIAKLEHAARAAVGRKGR